MGEYIFKMIMNPIIIFMNQKSSYKLISFSKDYTLFLLFLLFFSIFHSADTPSPNERFLLRISASLFLIILYLVEASTIAPKSPSFAPQLYLSSKFHLCNHYSQEPDRKS